MGIVERFSEFVPRELCVELMAKDYRKEVEDMAAENAKDVEKINNIIFSEAVNDEQRAIIKTICDISTLVATGEIIYPDKGDIEEQVEQISSILAFKFLQTLTLARRDTFPRNLVIRLNLANLLPIELPRNIIPDWHWRNDWFVFIKQSLQQSSLTEESINKLYSAFVDRVKEKIDKSLDGLKLFGNVVIKKDNEGYYLDYEKSEEA